MRVFFYCVGQNPKCVDSAFFQHLTICLAEGLSELGHQLFSNINYWPLSISNKGFLLSYFPEIHHSDCDLVIVNQDWFFQHKTLPKDLFKPGRSYKTIFLDRCDGSRTPLWREECREFDVILKTHYNSRIGYPGNVKPWAFGLSNRIIAQTSNIFDWEQRKKELLVNFRNGKHAHTVRKTFYRDVLPVLSLDIPINSSIESYDNPPLDSLEYLYWLQSGGRHYERYYQRLKETRACACFGGFYEPYFPADKSGFLARIQRKLIGNLRAKTKIIGQWDSWRLWETFSAKSAVFHVDFNQYGLVLPEMPNNWDHYVGMDLWNPRDTICRLQDEPGLLKKIAAQGHAWSMKYYAPRPTAVRLLNMF